MSGLKTLSLAEQLDEARERIRELEDAARPSGVAFYDSLQLTLNQSVILDALLEAKKPVTPRQLRLKINLANTGRYMDRDASAEVAVSRLRARLRPQGIAIRRLRDQGLYLDTEDKMRLLAIRVAPKG